MATAGPTFYSMLTGLTVKTAISNVEMASSNITVMLAGPDGTLGAPSTVATSLPYFVEAAADINGDGIPDLLLDGGGGNGFNVGLAVMLGQPGGSFSAPSPLPATATFKPVFALVADFAAAGTPDIVYVSYLNGNTYILLNQGDGSFQAPAVLPSLIVPPTLAGDVTGDGKLDIVAVGPQFNAGVQLVVSLGNGDGTFQQPTTPRAVLGTTMVGLDLNGDGKMDLAQRDGDLVTFFLSNGDGTFQTLPINLGVEFPTLVVADFNSDGKPDMANSTDVALNTTVIAAITGALNGESFATSEPLTPGSLVSIFGSDFATSNSEAGAIPLPPTLGSVSVTIGGTPAPLLFVSPSQINVQVPWEVSGSTADIVVTTAQGTALAPFSAPIGSVSPGIFTTQSGQVAINPDGAAGGDTLRYTSATPTVLIGGATAPLAFSGLSPQFVGVDQLNVTVPKVAAGVVALQISISGITTSDLVTIAVEDQ
jgi:hypothetical protein